MKICLVSSFPPSKIVLNEYGYHVAKELQTDPLVSLTVMADKLHEAEAELAGFNVERCWEINRLSNHGLLIRAIREIRPDVVWFNLVFSSFGNRDHPLAAFSGLTLPAVTRMAGYYTHVTLHHLMDHIDLNDSGVRNKTLFRMAGHLATRMILTANSAHPDRQIPRRKYSLPLPRDPFGPARISGFLPPRKSRTPHPGLRKVGHL